MMVRTVWRVDTLASSNSKKGSGGYNLVKTCKDICAGVLAGLWTFASKHSCFALVVAVTEKAQETGRDQEFI